MLPRRPALPALLTALPFVALLVAVLAASKGPLAVDRWWVDVVGALRTPWLTTLMSWVSAAGGGLFGGVVVPALVALVVWGVASARAAAGFVAVELLSLVAVQVVKHAVARPRPPTATVADLFSSFPSGHTAHAATMTALLVVLLRRRWLVVLAVSWTTVMALSRTYLGEHWLSDTVAGASLGVAVVLACAPALTTWSVWPFRPVRRQPPPGGPAGSSRSATHGATS
ncbi:phosphatase PAP2 family protein [Luteimicrobium subarcticum]|uniref:Undecaprenyl-diphosphatase n=1 Tax=Luteimicrobium subarcticum TaxID=620910 RepID=A0A2M8WUV0_9MICO|nr:phosphatase PAP2 family protein [Luteimicrobium subarcticum]PJI94703.1 undecaprenyl-diphosphatase [Luteimicrobium subarcticum]